MRFTTAWASVLSQNVTLKVVVLILAMCSIVLSIAAAKLALREPLLIERGCFTKTIGTTDTKHTGAEIEGFAKAALAKRFDTDAQGFKEFLADDEVSYRNKEQDELSKKGMTQRVLVNSVKINGSSLTVEADRILSLGKIRSALIFPLHITIGTTERTDGNPYGLIIKQVSPIQEANNEK